METKMKIIKLSLVAGLSLAWFSSLNAAGIADIYWYEAKPGKVQEVEALMRPLLPEHSQASPHTSKYQRYPLRLKS